MAIGADIHYDFSNDVPEISSASIVEEPPESYGHQRVSLSECLRQREEWKKKYYDLLERFVNKEDK